MSNKEIINKAPMANRVYVTGMDENNVIGSIPEIDDVSVFKLNTQKGVTKPLAEEERLMHIKLSGSICNVNEELVKNYQIMVNRCNPNSHYPLIYMSYYKDLSKLYKKIIVMIIEANPFMLVLEIADNPLKKELYEFVHDKFLMYGLPESSHNQKTPYYFRSKYGF